MASGGEGRGIPQETPDDGRSLARHNADTGMGLPQIAKTNVFKPGSMADMLPWAPRVVPGLAPDFSGDHEEAPLGSVLQDIDRSGVQHAGLRAGLGVRQVQQATLEINLRSAQVQDLSKPAAGEQEEAKGVRDLGRMRDQLVLRLGPVLRSRPIGLDEPWKPRHFCRPRDLTDALELLR